MAIDAVEFGITYAKAIDVNTGESKELFKEGNDALKKAVERLKELPSAEPEIIRCKDCKYWQDNNGGYFNDECRWWNEETPEPDDFCSYAERRGEQE